PAVLERLAAAGVSVAPVPGTAKVAVTVPAITAESEAEAKNAAIARVTALVPSDGYVVSGPEVIHEETRLPALAEATA
ncbi:MAG: hypothetical protein QOJ33_262, partial [Chloroflexota bacterium]|nr:hypothetical protein [Chloroflexota bacterium]